MSYVSCSTSTKDSLGGWMVVSTKCLNVTTWCSNESWFDYVTAWCIVVIKDPHFTLVRRWISSNSAAWLYSSVYPSILKDFEDGLFVLYTQILWAPALASVYVLIFFFFLQKRVSRSYCYFEMVTFCIHLVATWIKQRPRGILPMMDYAIRGGSARKGYLY